MRTHPIARYVANLVFVGVSLLWAFLPSSGYSSVPTWQGDLIVEYFKGKDHRKQIKDGRDVYVGTIDKIRESRGSFSIAANKEMFQIRSLVIGQRSTLKTLVTSDYDSVFYSQIVEQSTNKSGESVAWAWFSRGVMPNNLSGMEQAQFLSLAFLLTRNQPMLKELSGDLVPSVITKQLKDNLESRSPVQLRTHLERSETSATVAFWAVRKEAMVQHLAEGPACGLLARVEVTVDSTSLFKAITVERFHPFFSKAGFFGGEPHSITRYEMKTTGDSADSVFSDTAYETVDVVAVNDNRLGPTNGYKLTAGQKPAFEGTATYASTSKLMKDRIDSAKQDERKGNVVAMLCIGTIIPLWLAVRSVRNKQHTNKTINADEK